MIKETLELPIVLSGKLIYPGSGRENYVIRYESGVEVVIPKVSEDDLDQLARSDKYLLHGVHIQEIISFLQKVGRFWNYRNREHPLYQKALQCLMKVNGYDEKMAQREINIIESTCSLPGALHDLLDVELGNRFYMEEWIPRGDALIHTQPLGTALHVMVGNVPVSGIMSIVRSCITKNRTIGKLPKRDPVTTLFFVLSALEIDALHLVCQSMSIVYWQGGDDLEDTILPLADVVCVWGGDRAVKQIKAKVNPGVDVLEFGPKTSFAVIGRECVDSKKVAIDLAHDVALYDQEACFSPQMVFIEGNYNCFIEHLIVGLERYRDLLPKARAVPDVHAHVSRTRLEALYNGNDVLHNGDNNWTVIVIRDPSQIEEHPLSRVIYVIPVADIADCLLYVNPSIQTITLSPWSRNVEIREQATLRGATKITETGLVEAIRLGTTHDGVYPIQRLVRWVCIERGCDYWGKYIEQGPVDTTLWLMMNDALLEEIDVEAQSGSSLLSG